MTLDSRLKEIESRLESDFFTQADFADMTFLLSHLRRYREALEKIAADKEFTHCYKNGELVWHRDCRYVVLANQALNPQKGSAHDPDSK